MKRAKNPETFNGHRCPKRNLASMVTGYAFDDSGIGKRGKQPKAKHRPKNYIG